MADQPNDPAALWRTLLGDWEKGVNAYANKAMEKEEFARSMGALTNAANSAQGAMGDLMGRYLQTLNLPSRAEIASIGERLQAIEAQLNHITVLVRAMAGSAAVPMPPASRPKRTRKPPGRTGSEGGST